jgi:hypothetical protein
MELHNHYKAVRARLNGAPIKPAPEPEKELDPVVVLPTPPLMAMEELNDARMLYGMPCSYETRQQILPVLKKYNMTWKSAISDSRKSVFIKVRYEIYIVLSANGWSLNQIGRMCGGRDHTTILSSLNRFADRYLTDAEKEMVRLMEVDRFRYCYWKMKLRDHAYS